MHAGAAEWIGTVIDDVTRVRCCPGCGQRDLRRFPLLVDEQPLVLRVRRRNWTLCCSACGLVFGSHRPAAKQIRAYYEPSGDWSRGHQLTADHGEVAEALFDSFDRAIGLQQRPGARALDVGCGSGTWLNALARHGWSTFGIEPSSNAAFARHQELTAIPADASFDLLIFHHVLEHVDSPARILAEGAAALRPGGAILISVPSLDNLAVHSDLRYCINARTHLQAFTFSCMQTLLSVHGFDDVRAVNDPALDGVTRRPALRLRVVARRTSSSRPAVPSDPPLAAAWMAFQRAGYLRAEQWDAIG